MLDFPFLASPGIKGTVIRVGKFIGVSNSEGMFIFDCLADDPFAFRLKKAYAKLQETATTTEEKIPTVTRDKWKQQYGPTPIKLWFPAVDGTRVIEHRHIVNQDVYIKYINSAKIQGYSCIYIRSINASQDTPALRVDL